MRSRRACWWGLLIAVAGCGEAASSTDDGVTARAAELKSVGEVITIDFSLAGQQPMSPTFFESQGVVFPEDSFVAFVQGDEALVTTVAGRFSQPVATVSVQLAPAIQGTAKYTLTAFSDVGQVVGTTSTTVTQDLGDPQTGPMGYFELALTDLPRCARSFSVENEFMLSTFSDVTFIPFGASTVAFTRAENCDCRRKHAWHRP